MLAVGGLCFLPSYTCMHTTMMCCIPHHHHCAASIYPQGTFCLSCLCKYASVTAAPHITCMACDTPTRLLHVNMWCQTIMCAHYYTMPTLHALAWWNAERPCPCLLHVLVAGLHETQAYLLPACWAVRHPRQNQGACGCRRCQVWRCCHGSRNISSLTSGEAVHSGQY